MTAAPQKPPRPLRNKGAGKLGNERAKAGVDKETSSGIHSLDPEEGELFEHDPADIGPNPMNRRIGLRNMEAMIDSVRRQGVHTPGAVMHTNLFMAQYPDWADRVKHPERTYILGPGHRRHAAALKAGKPMLAILRNDWAKDLRVEENLISENNDRDDLSPIEQALQLDLLRQRGMTGDEIAERSGYSSRGTISRFLNLLDLPQEIQDKVHAGDLSHSAGYTLSTLKDDQDVNDSEAAHAIQLKAFSWMRNEGLSAEAAKNRLKQQAVFPAGNTQEEKSESAPSGTKKEPGVPKGADPVSRGKHEGAEQHAGSESTESTGSESVGTSIPHQAGSAETGGAAGKGEPGGEDDGQARLLAAQESADQRDLACRLLLREEKYAGAADLTLLLVNAVLNPGEWKQAADRAHEWLRDHSKGPKSERPSAYFTAVATGSDAILKRRCAFAVALAANEVRAAKPDREWDDRDRAHLAFLMTSKAAYQPTEYEQELLSLTAFTTK
ncbi:ParB/RepB/Spo0J family partition protein [Streptomyces sp. NPDC051644]|uniref:ParB/RepB/Spo0J family partition protein n=1 Tax=Streptomyces sp. NPDC051644 TaxID=3365666 RepID=UPI0037937F9B